MSSYNLSHLKQLEHEAIFILREVAAAQFERPVLLFSGGKDSIVMVKLAQQAFYPGDDSVSRCLHIDTGHNFDETIEYRDWLVKDVGARLLVRSVQDSIDKGRCAEEKGVNPSRNGLQTVTLLDALEELRADAAIGGGRRDEEKARAKERFLLAPRRVRPVGPEEPAARALESFQRSPAPGRGLPRFPSEQLDGDGRVAIYRGGED